MEQKLALLRKKRVRAQQNIITALCLLCMVFTVGWSVHAAVAEQKAIKAANIKASNAAKEKAEKEKAEKAKKEEKKEEPSSAAEESSQTDSEAVDTSLFVHPYERPTDTADDLSDAVFIGDSRTVGMMNSTDMPQATFLCAVGINIDTVLTSYDLSLGDGTTGSLTQALSARQFGRVYISFGTNEMGWPYIDVFKEHYTEMVQTIRDLQPDATIYLVGILPLTASQDAKGESVNNANARAFSEAISEVADEMGLNYLDCSAAVADENGYLPEEASTDGIHMNAEYCLYWQNFIIDNT